MWRSRLTVTLFLSEQIVVNRDRPRLLSAAVVAACLTIGSAWAAYGELKPFLQLGPSLEAKVAALAAAPVTPGLSYRSKLLVLTDCNTALTSIAGAALQPDLRRAMLDNCAAIARSIVEEAPTYSFAWFILAIVAEEKGDTARMGEALLRSQQTAPHQEWLALSRATLAFDHLDVLSAEAAVALADDVRLSLVSRRGVTWAAQRYVLQPDLRERLTEMVELAPAALQQRFLTAVRQQTALGRPAN